MDSMQIAKTILEQIKFSDRSALMAWGAKQYLALGEEKRGERMQLGGVQFSVNGLKFKGKVLVRLMANDTYVVEIGTINTNPRSKEFGVWKVKAEVKEVYCDTLMQTIDGLIER